MPAPERALILGGTGLIGLAIAQRLGRSGRSIILNYLHDERRADRALQALRDRGITASLACADVTDEAAVRTLFDDVLAAGPIDVLVHAVGTFRLKPFLETNPAEWDETLTSNLRSAYLSCRAAIPAMRARRRGSITLMASMNAHILRARPSTLPYAIAKAGIVLLTKTLAATEASYGVRVNAVSPGFVRGAEHPPQDVEKIPLGREADASEIADAVEFLASNEAAYITGAVLDVHGGAFL
jgi:3-oxoacyl-[acyl-carrier protein] reductase